MQDINLSFLLLLASNDAGAVQLAEHSHAYHHSFKG